MRLAIAELDLADEELSHPVTSQWLTEETPILQKGIQDIEDSMIDNQDQDQGLFTSSQTPPPVDNTLEDTRVENEIFEDISGLSNITNRRGRYRTQSVSPNNTAPRAGDISADLDTNNVLPEGVRRQARSSTRHDTYSTQLALTGTGSLNVFHNAFAAFTSSSLYYHSSPLLSNIDLVLAKSEVEYTRPSSCPRRGNLSPEPRNFKELTKHPYCESFKTAMRIELDGLKRKNT